MNFSACLGNIYKKITNIVFIKIYIIFIIAITIPAVSISMLIIKYSSDNIVKQVSYSTDNILEERTRIIDQRISEIDNLIMQCAFDGNIISMQENNESTIVMSEIIKMFNKIVKANKLVKSIYFYDDKHDFVLTDETKYKRNDFFDNSLFQLNFNGNVSAIYRNAVNSANRNEPVISYIRRFRDISDNKGIYFVLNLDYNVLFGNIADENSDNPMDELILDENNNIIFINGITSNTFDNGVLQKISISNKENRVIRVDKDDFFISKIHSDKLNWTIVYLQPNSSLLQTANLQKKLVTSLMVIVLIISFGLAYIFSTYLYKPLANLVQEIQKYSENSISKNDNEYHIINETLKNMFNRYNELSSRYQFAFPYFLQYFVYGMINDEFLNPDILKDVLKQIGKNFEFGTYATVLIDFENTMFTGEVKGNIENYFAKEKNNYESIMSKISDTSLVMIINTDKKIEDVYDLLSELKKDLNNKNIMLTISLGKPYDSLKNVYMSFKDVLKQMDTKFFKGKNEIIYSGSCESDFLVDNNLLLEKKLEIELISNIKSQNYENAVEALRGITECITRNKGSIEYIRYFYFNIATNITNSLNVGIKAPDYELSGTYIYENIQKSETFSELQEFMNSLISKCILLEEELKKMQYTNLVSKTISFIKNNYSSDISIDEISSNVFLSPRHINSIFKNGTGMSVTDYITKVRMEAAKDIIMNENVKIQDVASKVGYNNIQTFFRLFKKYYGMTPIELRRSS